MLSSIFTSVVLFAQPIQHQGVAVRAVLQGAVDAADGGGGRAGLVGERGNEVWVSTFHAMCARILRRDIEKLGYTRSFTTVSYTHLKTPEEAYRFLEDVLTVQELKSITQRLEVAVMLRRKVTYCLLYTSRCV